jgi:hypothetical protein
MSYIPASGTATGTSFYPLEDDGGGYPRPVVSLLPLPSWNEWFGRPRSRRSAFFGGGESFVSGRYALAEAMRRAGAGPGKAVLVPSFHCRSMVEPAIFLGAEPLFYPVSSDLRPDFKALSGLMTSGATPVAMLLTHYFGFPNAVAEADDLCRRHGIALIEDCAHALYGGQDGFVPGGTGDYAVASLWKFLPVREGAVLLDRSGKRSERSPRPRGMFDELKAAARLMKAWSGRAWRRRALPDLEASAVNNEADRIQAGRRALKPQPGLKEFSPRLADTAALHCTRWLAEASAHGCVALRRREHYAVWLAGVRDLPGVRPLYPELPQGVVPYAFPLLLAEPEPGFRRLKTAGVPIWRWEDMAVTACMTAQSYRLRLLQLPCHQGLSASELEWMIRAVRILVPGEHR